MQLVHHRDHVLVPHVAIGADDHGAGAGRPAPLGPGESCGIAVGFRPEAFWAGREDLAVLGLSVFDPATGVPIDSVLVEFRGVTKL